MVGGATPLLSARRAGALLVLVVGLAAWDEAAGSLPRVGENWDVALVSLVLMPATFAVVLLALPLAHARGLLPVAIAFGAAAAALDAAGLDGAFNVVKLLALALFGFWFLWLFYELWWIVLVAGIIPVVDSLSVWRGPTKVVVEEQPGLFERISIAFRLPGEDRSANLGPPDIVFFALFLAAAERFGLRVGWTWLAMTALVAATLIATVVFDVDGLPALPAVALGFLAANADLLWSRWRERGSAEGGSEAQETAGSG
ncbi:MAG: hypothetical protein OEV72_14585 [Thermoleophilia bacterium]|nr:hypothetical protein [Thermoleophilia bacterium]